MGLLLRVVEEYGTLLFPLHMEAEMPRARPNDVQDIQIIQIYKSCKSVPRTAEILGIGTATIARALAKNGVERIGLTEYRKTMGVKKDEPYIGIYTGSTQEILDWYASGMSMKAIAAKIGRSVHIVARRVKQAGISRPWRGKGPEHSSWTGGRNSGGGGYLRNWIDEASVYASMRNKNGYVKEHRLVLAQKLGRPLLPTETVHHIDGDRSNNALENLQLRQGKHGKHMVMCCMECGSRNVGPIKIE